jgi:hypothetical protein
MNPLRVWVEKEKKFVFSTDYKKMSLFIAFCEDNGLLEKINTSYVIPGGSWVFEGDIINANGYNSILGEYHHEVTKGDDDITLGSDIYSDWEPLSSYDSIEVIGNSYQNFITKEDE